MSLCTQNWTPTERELPPEGEVVETMVGDGKVSLLVYQDGRWFHADMVMYVYYVPKYWRKP